MAKPFEPQLEISEVQSAFSDISDISGPMSGGEGTVFKAYKKSLDKYVAIKIYSKDHLKARTELEVQKLSNINSPHLVKLYDSGEVNIRGNLCYYTETSFIEGLDLRKILDSGKTFSEKEVVEMIRCISKAIDALWQQRAVHCDIKPDNILKSNEGNYVLIDLGIAKHLDAAPMTEFGVIMGTLGYLAPEQFRGRKNLTLRADYYALGIVAFELLAGFHPFNRNQMSMLTNSLPPLPSTVNINQNLKNIIYNMTEIITYNRPKSYQDIENALEG